MLTKFSRLINGFCGVDCRKATKKVFGFVLYLNVSMTFYYDSKRTTRTIRKDGA